jgi:hypothetical protein
MISFLGDKYYYYYNCLFIHGFTPAAFLDTSLPLAWRLRLGRPDTAWEMYLYRYNSYMVRMRQWSQALFIFMQQCFPATHALYFNIPLLGDCISYTYTVGPDSSFADGLLLPILRPLPLFNSPPSL